jgi:hypothetical protein
MLSTAIYFALPLFLGNSLYMHWLFCLVSSLSSLVLFPIGAAVVTEWQTMESGTSVFALTVIFLLALVLLPVAFSMVLLLMCTGNTHCYHAYSRDEAYKRAVQDDIADLLQHARDPNNEHLLRCAANAALPPQRDYLESCCHFAYRHCAFRVRSCARALAGSGDSARAQRRMRVVYFPQRMLLAFALSVLFVVACFFALWWYSEVIMLMLEQYHREYVQWQHHFDSVQRRIVATQSYLSQLGTPGIMAAVQIQNLADQVHLPSCSNPHSSLAASACSVPMVRLVISFLNWEDGARALLDEFNYAFQFAIRLAAFLGITMTCIVWCQILKLYRQRVARIRRGDYPWNPVNFHSYSTSSYIALQSLQFLVGFVFACVFCGTLVFCVAHGTIRRQLFGALFAPLLTISVATFILQGLAKLIARVCLIQRDFIVHLRLFLVFDFAFNFLAVVSGILVVAVRVLLLMFVYIAQLMRLDLHPLSQSWASSWDVGFASYVNTLYIDARHNNPIVVSFCSYLRESAQLQRAAYRKAHSAFAASDAKAGGAAASAYEDDNSATPLSSSKLARCFAALRGCNTAVSRYDRNDRAFQRKLGAFAARPMSFRRAQKRWWLFYTLARLPWLRQYRKHSIEQSWDKLRAMHSSRVTVHRRESRAAAVAPATAANAAVATQR